MSPAPSGSTPSVGATATLLRYVILASLIVLGVVGGAGMTRPSHAGWAGVILVAMCLWAGWLYWRTATGDRNVPAHLLHPFIACISAVLLVHLFRQGSAGAEAGRIQLLGAADSNVLLRLLALTLLVLLVQDVLSRVRRLRWLLTGLGVFVATGAVLRLYTSPAPDGAAAVTLGGLTGVGMMLTPLLLPDWPAERLLRFMPERHRRFGAVARVAVGVLLGALLLVRHPGCAVGGVIAVGAVAVALLGSGAFHPHHRRRMLPSGGVLAVVAVVGAVRLGPSAPPWLGAITTWGTGVIPADPGASGLWVLAASAGWAGPVLLIGGVLIALTRSLWAGRTSATGDQARSALWAAVVLMASSALLAPGGMGIPSAAIIAAIALGLMPHMMVHHVRRFHGALVIAAFAVALLVMGLGQMLSGSAWTILATRYGDGLLHMFGTFVLAGVLFWQVARRRTIAAVACAVAAAAIASLGEVAQRCLSSGTPEWSDVAWNCVGAAGALGVWLVIHAARWVERIVTAAAKPSTADYETWRHVSVVGTPASSDERPTIPPPDTPTPSAPAHTPQPQFARSDRPTRSGRKARPARRR